MPLSASPSPDPHEMHRPFSFVSLRLGTRRGRAAVAGLAVPAAGGRCPQPTRPGAERAGARREAAAEAPRTGRNP